MHKPEKVKTSRITMKSMAEQLGISASAVHLALKGLPGVSSATRNKVQRLSRDLNYRPDPAVSAAASARWNTGAPERHSVIAFLCFATPTSQIQQDTYLQSARAYAHETGYRLEPFFADKYPDAKSLSKVLYTRGIKGILIPPVPEYYTKTILKFEWDWFISVSCGFGRMPLPLHTVADNVFINTRLPWKVAVEAGFRRIGAVLHFHDPIDEDDWNRIGASFASQHILEIPVDCHIPPMLGPFNNDDLLYKWFCKYQPDLIIGFNNSTAVTLSRKGVRFPHDAAFISLSTIENSQWSGIIRPFQLIAQKSVEILVDEISTLHRGKPAMPRITCIPPGWNAGLTFTAGTSLTRCPHFLSH